MEPHWVTYTCNQHVLTFFRVQCNWHSWGQLRFHVSSPFRMESSSDSRFTIGVYDSNENWKIQRRYNEEKRKNDGLHYVVCLALFGHHAESSTRAAFHFPCTRPRCRYRSSLPHLRPYHHVHQISFHFILTTLGQPPYPRSSQSRRPVNRSVEARLAPLPSLLRL